MNSKGIPKEMKEKKVRVSNLVTCVKTLCGMRNVVLVLTTSAARFIT